MFKTKIPFQLGHMLQYIHTHTVVVSFVVHLSNNDFDIRHNIFDCEPKSQLSKRNITYLSHDSTILPFYFPFYLVNHNLISGYTKAQSFPTPFMDKTGY